MSDETVDCPFCEEMRDAEASPWTDSGSSRVLAQRSGFVLVPSLGPLARGHSMLIPTQHCPSFAALDDDQRGKAQQLVALYSRALTPPGRATVVFEHGMLRGSAGGCGICHAHIHIVPVDDVDLSPPEIGDAVWEPLRRDGWIASLPRDSEYVMVGTSSGPVYAARVHDLPSQFMRRWLADRLGHDQWDWRLAPPTVPYRVTENLRRRLPDPQFA
jgi:diadenosine tetraphosphate (Ap4A) HIT family hydrolase